MFYIGFIINLDIFTPTQLKETSNGVSYSLFPLRRWPQVPKSPTELQETINNIEISIALYTVYR